MTCTITKETISHAHGPRPRPHAQRPRCRSQPEPVVGAVEIVIGLLAAVGSAAGGSAAWQTWRSKRSNTALDALTLAIQTFVDDNGQLRDRLNRVEAELESCEKSKLTQGQRIGELESKVRAMESARG